MRWLRRSSCYSLRKSFASVLKPRSLLSLVSFGILSYKAFNAPKLPLILAHRLPLQRQIQPSPLGYQRQAFSLRFPFGILNFLFYSHRFQLSVKLFSNFISVFVHFYAMQICIYGTSKVRHYWDSIAS